MNGAILTTGERADRPSGVNRNSTSTSTRIGLKCANVRVPKNQVVRRTNVDISDPHMGLISPEPMALATGVDSATIYQISTSAGVFRYKP